MGWEPGAHSVLLVPVQEESEVQGGTFLGQTAQPKNPKRTNSSDNNEEGEIRAKREFSLC